jgi:hypothetical protein
MVTDRVKGLGLARAELRESALCHYFILFTS